MPVLLILRHCTNLCEPREYRRIDLRLLCGVEYLKLIRALLSDKCADCFRRLTARAFDGRKPKSDIISFNLKSHSRLHKTRGKELDSKSGHLGDDLSNAVKEFFGLFLLFYFKGFKVEFTWVAVFEIDCLGGCYRIC